MRGGLAVAAALGCGAPPGPAREVAVERVSQPSPAATNASASEIRLPVVQAPVDQVPAAVAGGEERTATAEALDPRVPPPGTPPAIARVFQRLPVAIQDQPPVGGIGATGIHVDKIWLGESYEREGCSGEAERFSLARHRQVNVCFRVVHSRVEESVEVLWEKDGEPFRRRAVQIPDLHAYRTRAYLVLRREYIGSWRARVLSVDGVELAAKTFEVVE
ncbi:MAG TPA: DUF2914 domain-containing protein [Nannocystis sp.]